MTRLNISFHARVPTLHPSMLMTLLSVLSVLRLFGISVTLATPSITDLNPAQALNAVAPILTDEAKRALALIPDPNQLIANLAPAISEEAKTALSHANINPLDAISSLTPVLTEDASKALNQANINPASAIAGLAPVLTEDATKVLSQARINPVEAVTSVPSNILTDLGKGLDAPANALLGLASPFQAAEGGGPLLEANPLNALTHAGAIPSKISPSIAPAEHILDGPLGEATTTAMHNDISAQVSQGTLSKEGALAAHAALYNVLSARVPKLGI